MWLVITLAVITLFIVLLLSIPIGLIFSLDIYGRPKVSLAFLWMFGLINRPIKFKKKKKPAIEKKAKPRKKGRGFKFWGMLRTRGLFRQLFRLIKDILACIHIRQFELNLKLGLDSPADTGFVFGCVHPVSIFLPAHCSVIIEPEFSDTIFEGYSRGTITLKPICLVGPILRFVFSMASLRIIWGLITGKWKKKK